MSRRTLRASAATLTGGTAAGVLVGLLMAAHVLLSRKRKVDGPFSS